MNTCEGYDWKTVNGLIENCLVTGQYTLYRDNREMRDEATPSRLSLCETEILDLLEMFHLTYEFFGDWPSLLVTRMSKTRCSWALWLTGFGSHSQLDGRSVNSLFCTMRVWSPININTDCYFWHRLSVWIVSRLTRQYETEIQVIIGYIYIKKRYSHPRSRYLHFI